MKDTRRYVFFGLFLIGALGVVLLGSVVTRLSTSAVPPADPAAEGQQQQQRPVIDNPFLAQALGGNTGSAALTLSESVEIIRRLLLAVLLSGVLAFRPRKNVPLFRRSLFVSQTQILLSVVAAALMMIVGDNTARAFAIFAAVSLVRFRTNIRDPKEITVLLISLGLGLAAGVGRWDLGIALCLFALALLWILEFNESEQTFRSMELSVKTRNPDKTQEVLTKIFRRLKIDAEVREIVPPDEKKQIGAISYYLNMRLKLTTDQLSDRILSADTDNIEGIQWSKTKSVTDIFQ
ncbi:MAG: DUF4956 domain-containing protein [Acidobacteria bacterium]|nr:DUF4956 domain-containing protein [Acidobacteriota bacterium]